jgi:hypothetical protein
MASQYRIPELAFFGLALLGMAPLVTAAGTGTRSELPNCMPPPAGIVTQRPLPSNVRLVTGAPYSAMGTSETVTTLPDGNRIVRQNTVRMWRDSDGRTRSEYSLSSIGGPVPLEVNSTLTVIDDPAAGTRYLVQPGQNVATQSIEACRAPLEGEPGFVGPVRAPRGALTMSRPQRLGERTLDGETVAGSRIEATIPAGAIGNEQPITMTAEQWYGRKLQVVVEATYRDPRTGETRYKLRNIKRQEPDAALFRAPQKEAHDGKKDQREPRNDAPPLPPAGFKR